MLKSCRFSSGSISNERVVLGFAALCFFCRFFPNNPNNRPPKEKPLFFMKRAFHERAGDWQ
jgi:hypothetical protein